eukprot:TRINITY_DN15454_c0_g1_i1.p1 TRINITY_DN15454_c0_g1~~TRINITY_DN15454_c0_g1_i1.p1  ORF type:complete len:1851 (+),score=381.48 TRINITY_DN15454_c0_g1_i1:173-5725(+)
MQRHALLWLACLASQLLVVMSLPRTVLPRNHGLLLWLACLASRHAAALPASGERFAKFEKEELAFAKKSLLRELTTSGGSSTGVLDENVIRRAHRKIALRYRQHLLNTDTDKFDFQMRILNLARDALVRGEHPGGATSTGGSDAGDGDDEEEGMEPGSGRELPAGSRMSEDILKQIYSWQEYALEEGVRFDSPDMPFFEGHTLHGFHRQFEANWTHFVRTELVEMWPAAALLRLHVELGVSGESMSSDGSARERARRLSDATNARIRDALVSVANLLHSCGAKEPSLEGPLPHNDDPDSWLELQLRSSRALRKLLTGIIPGISPVGEIGGRGGNEVACAAAADRAVRLSLLEVNLEALVHLDTELASLGPRGGGAGGADRRADVAAELRFAHAAVDNARAEAAPLHCREVASQRRAALDKLWEDYQFGPVVAEAYPLDACSLDGLASFVEFHTGAVGELLERKAEPDRSMLRALRGMLMLQRAVARPASLDSGQWRDAVADLEAAVWKGTAFPDLQEAAGKLMAEVVGAGLMPRVLEAALEHPPVYTATGVKSHLGREPSDVQPSKERRFAGLTVPGFNMKPIERYEDLSLSSWGDEDIEDNWDPVRLGLSFIDLVPACELPIQIAVCFLNAALWFWRALQLLGDNCGGDGWLDTYIFEDLFSVPPDAKRLAMKYALKKGVFELVEYAVLFADHHLQPGARLAVHRTGYLTLWKVVNNFGSADDAPRLLQQLKRLFTSARLNPFWAPPVLQVSDAVFADILGSRLHVSFLEGLQQGPLADMARAEVAAQQGDPVAATQTGPPVPGALLEHCLYEGSLMGGGELAMELSTARFEVMGALLRDRAVHRQAAASGGVTNSTWSGVESLVLPTPMQLDLHGFATARRLLWPTVSIGETTSTSSSAATSSLASTGAWPGHGPEYRALHGVRIDLRSGRASLLMARPSSGAAPILALDDLPELVGLEDNDALFLSLEPPLERGGIRQYHHHPFQRAVVGVRGLGRRAELTLLHAAFSLQQVAAGNEVAMRAPFPIRPCHEGLCQTLPRAVQQHVTQVSRLPGEPWDAPPRLMVECNRLSYSQRMDGETLEILFGEANLEVHPGKPLNILNEEIFKTWPVSKLREALRRVEERDENSEAELPALEKHELVSRLLRALDYGGKLLEDEEEAGNAMARFARRFSHYLPHIRAAWPQFDRLAPLCALRAAGLVLKGQVEQMRDSARQQQESMRASAAAHVEHARQQQSQHWKSVLADVHSSLLRELGFVDTDPEGCFAGGDGRTFAACCSLGGHAASCWQGDDAEVPGSADSQRCCGPAARRAAAGTKPQLVAAVAAQLGGASPRRPAADVLLPAVTAWLQNPAGAADDGQFFSDKVIDLLAEEVREEDFVKSMGDHLEHAPNKLADDMAALSRLVEPGRLSVNSGPSDEESWLPVPPAASSGGRRSLFATVAFTPTLEAVEVADVLQVRKDVQVEEVPLDELASRIGRTDAPSRPSASVAAEVGILQEAALMLSRLDRRAEEPWQSSSSEQERVEPEGYMFGELKPTAVDEGDCSYDGWREVPDLASERLALVQAGQRIRTRRRMSEDLNGEVGTVRAVLSLTGRPGERVTVWEVIPEQQGAPIQYLEPSDSSLAISVPCQPSDAGVEAVQPTDIPTQQPERPVDIDEVLAPAAIDAPWPACIENGIAFPSSDGAGLFLNLEALNLTSGCFLNDCSYSDHFACASPADCARICAHVASCRWWTFQELAPATCWLRGAAVKTREEAPSYMSGSRSCVASEEKGGGQSAAEPDLMDLVLGQTGVPAPNLWKEPDLIAVLKDFGNLTVRQLQRARPSVRQLNALRIAAIASSKCGESWQGCT